MAWTSDQKTNLNNSMSAAQDVMLGTFLGELVGVPGSALALASGQATITSACTPVVTGLTTVTYAVGTMIAKPTMGHMWTTVVAGSVAGVIQISAWQPTNASTVTPIPSTGSYVKVNWIAVGT